VASHDHNQAKRALKMSEIVSQAVVALNEKMGGAGFDGTAKFEIEGEGCVMIDSSGARASDDDAEVTLTADVETFQGIMSGDTNPTRCLWPRFWVKVVFRCR
jgi:putative sterol carrier protein